MATRPFCTGFVSIYASVGSSGSPLYIGTGERAPKRRHVKHYSQVMNDRSGVMEPFDSLYQGRFGIVTVRLSAWNYENLIAIWTAPTAEEGVDLLEDHGKLMMTDEEAGQLWLVYANGGGGGSMPGMPSGYHYPIALLETDEDQPGTDAEYIDLTWLCRRKYDDGRFTLYDTDVGGLPNPD